MYTCQPHDMYHLLLHVLLKLKDAVCSIGEEIKLVFHY